MMKWKLASWVSLFACASHMATLRRAESDFRSVAASVMFSVMGLFMAYFKR